MCLNSLCDSVLIKSDEWGGPHVAHYWKQRGGNSGEEHPLSDVGYRRTGVAAVLLEHLLLQHRGEQHVLDTFPGMKGNRSIVQQWVFWQLVCLFRAQTAAGAAQVRGQPFTKEGGPKSKARANLHGVLERRDGESRGRGRCVKESFLVSQPTDLTHSYLWHTHSQWRGTFSTRLTPAHTFMPHNRPTGPFTQSSARVVPPICADGHGHSSNNRIYSATKLEKVSCLYCLIFRQKKWNNRTSHEGI